MKDFITQYIKGCATCQMHKVNTHPTRPPLYLITADPDALPFQVIALNFITKLPISDGFDRILTITDHDCSKASILIPCNENITAEGTAELYAKYMVSHYSIPAKVISDQDPHFRAEFTKEMCRILGIKQNISSTNHPQTDGQSERTNQSMEQYL
jgi:transposase InsO family protein